ncbi:MAG TPA: hypothetical protein VGK10_01980 [Prolixibacteraceae bacterium]|jgi:hypothetical protein
MKKSLFIMMFAIAAFGVASAQVEPTTPPQNSGTTNQNQSTTPNTQTKKQGTYQNQGTTTTTPQGTYEKQGTSTTTTPQGTYEKQGTGTYEKQGTSTTTTPQGTYEKQSPTSPNTQNIDTLHHTQGTMNKAQGTMNKAQGTMDRTQDKMNKAQGVMSKNEKGWTKIGEKTVNTAKDREEITLTGAEKFSSIKIKVPEDAMVDLKDVVVEYEGGAKQNVDMGTLMNSSTGESKVIDLTSSDRNVKKVSFAYTTHEAGMEPKSSTSTSKGTTSTSKGTKSSTSSTTKGTQGTSKAKIEVWGLKSDTALK